MNRSADLSADVESGAIGGDRSLYALPRHRSDLWNRLRDAARRMRRLDPEVDAARLSRLAQVFREALRALRPLESWHAFPGPAVLEHLAALHDRGELSALADTAVRVARIRSMGIYRRVDLAAAKAGEFLDLVRQDARTFRPDRDTRGRHYFELLLVDDTPATELRELRERFRSYRRPDDPFFYELVVASSFESALMAVLANPSITSCVLRYSFPFASEAVDEGLRDRLYELLGEDRAELSALLPGQRTSTLGALLARLRPELDLFRVTDAPVENVIGPASKPFRRVFYQAEDLQDLHASVLNGVAERFETPFFDAVRRYAERPTGMFHALPVSRARTIAKSHWIGDLGDFYGKQLFMAETSATTGGLDSLLQPSGSLREAQERAARAFGADRTFWVTNGTSTANKIVLQALVRPGDLVLLSHDCHKSHPYAVILSGAHPVYMDGYPLTNLSMYGGIPLRRIKKRLLDLKAAGQLHRARVLLLTNITFDGITYDPYRVMKEVLAIHPDIVFLWDEAWFAYGRSSPLLRRRTAMQAARRLAADLSSEAWRARYREWAEQFPKDDADAWLERDLLPDPDAATVRVYATHSTHKTLTALRQGSMIHVADPDFERLVSEPFHEAYMVHTSTSPNYQILATLDVGRRQVELEGAELVNESIDLALVLRERLRTDPLLSRWFGVLGPEEMVPPELRASGIERFVEPDGSLAPLEQSWRQDEFVLDPTRVTVHVGRTGMDGDTFKRHLMDRHAIHINKTSRNSVLFLIHIGAARGTIAHLVKVLTDIAEERERWLQHATPAERADFDRRVKALTEDLPPLPDFSRFHERFVPAIDQGTPAGDIRTAWFQAYDPDQCLFLALDEGLAADVAAGRELVAASFVTPYPPGFPVLVPGQIVTSEILDYLLALDVKEIHGLHPRFGLRVFRPSVLGAPEPP